MVPNPAVSASPGNLIEMQILGLLPGLQTQTVGVMPSYLMFIKLSGDSDVRYVKTAAFARRTRSPEVKIHDVPNCVKHHQTLFFKSKWILGVNYLATMRILILIIEYAIRNKEFITVKNNFSQSFL